VKPETGQFVAYARAMLERGKRMLDIGLAEDAGRAAYLACFHTAQAYIFERQDRVAKTHRGVRNTFFLLTDHDPRVDPMLRNFLARAYEFKGIADYATDPSETTTAEDATAAMETAARFVEAFAALANLPPVG
jgi:uncharacterized protein (UPF0332 family)